MQERGYTIDQIAAFLKERDMTIPTNTLKIYVQRLRSQVQKAQTNPRGTQKRKQKTSDATGSSVETKEESATHNDNEQQPDDDKRHGKFTPAPDTPGI
jgi:type IV secretory pathway TrbL component